MNKPGKTITGAQSVSRTLALLKQIADHHDQGIVLADLVENSGLQRSTAYRLVSCLVEEGFAQRDSLKRYRLGIASMQLGLTAMTRAPLLEACKPVMQAISRQTGEASYLVVRNGDYGHCLHCVEGAHPVKTHHIVVGSLRLLGLGTGGQTLLALLSDESIQALHARHVAEFERKGMTLPMLLLAAQRVRRSHIAETDSLITQGLRGVGVAFSATQGSHAAISVASLESRMTEGRAQWIGEVICSELEKAGFSKAPA